MTIAACWVARKDRVLVVGCPPFFGAQRMVSRAGRARAFRVHPARLARSFSRRVYPPRPAPLPSQTDLRRQGLLPPREVLAPPSRKRRRTGAKKGDEPESDWLGLSLSERVRETGAGRREKRRGGGEKEREVEWPKNVVWRQCRGQVQRVARNVLQHTLEPDGWKRPQAFSNIMMGRQQAASPPGRRVHFISECEVDFIFSGWVGVCTERTCGSGRGGGRVESERLSEFLSFSFLLFARAFALGRNAASELHRNSDDPSELAESVWRHRSECRAWNRSPKLVCPPPPTLTLSLSPSLFLFPPPSAIARPLRDARASCFSPSTALLQFFHVERTGRPACGSERAGVLHLHAGFLRRDGGMRQPFLRQR